MTEAIGFAARWVTFGAILVSLGAVVFRTGILGRATVRARMGVASDRRVALMGMMASLLVVPGALGRLFVQTAEMRFPDEPWTPVAWRLVRHTSWGHLWLAQVGIALVLAAAFLMASRTRQSAWAVASLAAVALAITPSLASHAMSAQWSRIVTVGADSLHILGAGCWLGTLFVLCVVLAREREPGVPLLLVSAFSPVAMASVGVVMVTGLVSSLAHLDRVTALVDTPYGRLLAVKVGLVGLVGLVGWRNWKLLTPRLATGDVSAMRRSMVIELVAAAVVLVVTALLVVTTPPARIIS